MSDRIDAQLLADRVLDLVLDLDDHDLRTDLAESLTLGPGRVSVRYHADMVTDVLVLNRAGDDWVHVGQLDWRTTIAPPPPEWN